MKILELTEEHKKKLLEMSNKLFKDYPNFNSVEMCDQYSTHGMHCNDEYKTYVSIIVKTSMIYSAIHVHWFEFCIMQLCPKLTNCQAMFEDIESDDIKLTQHPIDYLYEKFKKLL